MGGVLFSLVRTTLRRRQDKNTRVRGFYFAAVSLGVLERDGALTNSRRSAAPPP